MNRLFVFTVLGALALVGSAARATASASVDATGLRVQVVDLDPSDGIAPAVTFDPTAGRSYLSATGGYGADAAFDIRRGATAFSSLAVAAGPADGVHSAMSLDGDIFGSGLAMHGSAYSTNQSFADCAALASLFRTNDNDSDSLPFTLSAHTELEISVAASGQAQVDDTNHELAQAVVNLFLRGRFDAGVPDSSSRLDLRVGGDDGPVTSTSGQQELFVSMTNESDVDIYGSFVGFAVVSAGNGPSAVPSVAEPGSAALLLSGVAAVAALARRRRRAVEA